MTQHAQYVQFGYYVPKVSSVVIPDYELHLRPAFTSARRECRVNSELRTDLNHSALRDRNILVRQPLAHLGEGPGEGAPHSAL